MADKLMYILNDDTQNYPLLNNNKGLIYLETQLDEPTNQNSIKVPKVVKNKKTISQNFVD